MPAPGLVVPTLTTAVGHRCGGACRALIRSRDPLALGLLAGPTGRGRCYGRPVALGGMCGRRYAGRLLSGAVGAWKSHVGKMARSLLSQVRARAALDPRSR